MPTYTVVNLKCVFCVLQVHERTEDLDFLLLVVKKLLHSNSRFVKVCAKKRTHHHILTDLVKLSWLPPSPTGDPDVSYN